MRLTLERGRKVGNDADQASRNRAGCRRARHVLCSVAWCALFALLVTDSRFANGDEIIIDSRMSEPIEIGGISWSPKFGFSGSLLELHSSTNGSLAHQSCELNAGELYKFFRDQGIQSVDQLVVVLTIPNSTAGDRFVLEGLQLAVNDSDNLGATTTILADSSQEHRVVIPGGQSISGRAEAKLLIPLGFDFMERYSEDSTERLVLNYKVEGSSLAESPVFMVEGQAAWSRTPTYAWVGVFVGFWLVLFWLLRVITFVRPKKTTAAHTTTSVPEPAAALAQSNGHASLKNEPASQPTNGFAAVGDSVEREPSIRKPSPPLVNSLS